MSEKMPSPEELNRIQKENLTDEQIEKDTIREDAYNAGLEAKELQKIYQALKFCENKDVVYVYFTEPGYSGSETGKIINLTATEVQIKRDIDFLAKSKGVGSIFGDGISTIKLDGISTIEIMNKYHPEDKGNTIYTNNPNIYK